MNGCCEMFILLKNLLTIALPISYIDNDSIKTLKNYTFHKPLILGGDF